MTHLSHEHVQHLYQEYGELKVLDDIICHRATDEPPVPILGYPRFKHSVDDYELFTGKQLDNFVDAAVKYFIRCGLEPPYFTREYERVEENSRIALIIHSSGSTVVEKVRPEAVQVVPYVLGLLAEKESGVNALRSCKLVTAAGARTPDELGDRLVKVGINLGVVFGTTEAGLAGDTVRRAEGDDSWNYIRIYSNIRQHIHVSPLGDNLFEFVYLEGHPALSTSEVSDDPLPGSWCSRDVFTPHPTIPDIWKYVTRLDDRVTLLNGEKVLPLPIEGRIREDPFVREAVVVGVDRTVPALLVFRTSDTDALSEDAYLDIIWSSVVDANSRAEAFSQISRDMIKVLPSHIAYPQTDKGSIIRAQVYKVFATEIEDLYTRIDNFSEAEGWKFELPALEEWIMTSFRSTIGISLSTLEADFFSSGVDSLKAIQMRRLIQNTLYLNGEILSPNVVYEKANAGGLAQCLFTLSHGLKIQQEDESALARRLIEKYSGFQKHEYRNGLDLGVGGDVVERWGNAALLTGATGSIGAHILSQLLMQEHITKVYYPVHGANPLQRVFASLSERQLQVSERNQTKLFAFEGDINKDNLGLDPSFFALMRRDVSLILHVAWPVNFVIPLKSFEPWIKGLYNLLQFSTIVKRPQPAQVIFASSISVALNSPRPTLVPNGPQEDFEKASPTGYARSKFVGEQIVRKAVKEAGARAFVLRIGQVVGDTKAGLWNDREFLPTMIRSALTLRALPILLERCSWLPVDTLATVILELADTLASSSRPLGQNAGTLSGFYNLVNPHSFSWDDLLHELHSCGLGFKSTSFAHWLLLLKESASNGEEADNPAVKSVEFFERSHGSEESLGGGGIRFDSSAAEKDSKTLRGTPWVVESGLVRKFVEQWMKRWDRTGGSRSGNPNGKNGKQAVGVGKGQRDISNGDVNGVTVPTEGHRYVTVGGSFHGPGGPTPPPPPLGCDLGAEYR
ncbi:MAG: hypothetical protein Q9178_002688 [Gyalolechia marmorata]